VCGLDNRCQTPGEPACSNDFVPSCTDAIRNGSELGIDCGGACAALCPAMTCGSDAECVTGRCNGVCELEHAAWRPGPALIIARYAHGCATLPDGSVYVVGGQGTTTLDSVEVLAPGALGFAPGFPLNDGRNRHGVAACDGTIYVAGGGITTESLTATGWVQRMSLPTTASSVSAVCGEDGRVYLPDYNTLHIYAPALDMWTAGPALGRDGYAIARQTLIYAIGGGSTGEATVSAWDGVGWRPRRAMATARRYLAGVTGSDGRSYAIGGVGGAGALDVVEAYTDVINTWASVPAMTRQRESVCATLAADGRIFVIGGRNPADGILETSELYGPLLQIAPTTGLPGGQIAVSGVGFAPNAAIAVALDGVPVAVGMTSSTGLADLSFVVPQQQPSGSHRVSAIDHRMQYPVTAPLVIP
jgi:hypothetical protein